jgi:uncharacterized delta-60 repeat protein
VPKCAAFGTKIGASRRSGPPRETSPGRRCGWSEAASVSFLHLSCGGQNGATAHGKRNFSGPAAITNDVSVQLRLKWICWVAVACVVSLAPATQPIFAAAAGSSGLQVESAGMAIAVQPNGKLVAAGITQPCRGQGVKSCAESSLVVARYSPAGKPDKHFGDGDGLVTLPVDDATSSLAGLALQADGKIVVAGGSKDLGVGQLALFRLAPSGTLDPSFGIGGGLTLPTSAFTAGASNALAVTPAGQILVAGAEPDPAGPKFAVAGFTTTGVLDPGFGTAGLASVRVDPSGGGETANALTLRPDGRIVVAGTAGRPVGTQAQQASFAVAQLLPDGTPDTAFAGDGTTTVFSLPTGGNGGVAHVGAQSVAISPSGDLVLAGSHTPFDLHPGCDQFSLVSLTPAGDPVSGFGEGGFVSASAPACAGAADLAFTSSGTIMVTGAPAGFESPKDPGKVAVRSFTTQGAVDSAFGAEGLVSKRLLGSASGTYAVTVDSRGSIYATGYVISDRCLRGVKHGRTSTCRALTLLRLDGHGKLDKSFGDHGLVTQPGLCQSHAKRCKPGHK